MTEFAGEVLHGDAWRGRDFTGRRVGVIASGRDAARVVPEVLRTARAVRVFQQEPDWVLPRLPKPVAGIVQAAARMPGGRRTLGGLHLRLRVRDEWTRRLLTPHRRFGSRAAVASNRYLAALQRPNCTLISWPVYAIVAGGVRTAEGIEHQVDCIVIPATVAGKVASPRKDVFA